MSLKRKSGAYFTVSILLMILGLAIIVLPGFLVETSFFSNCTALVLYFRFMGIQTLGVLTFYAGSRVYEKYFKSKVKH